jgi:hypothetical protein
VILEQLILGLAVAALVLPLLPFHPAADAGDRPTTRRQALSIPAWRNFDRRQGGGCQVRMRRDGLMQSLMI